MSGLIWWGMLATLATHEIDAMKRHEWRVLPLFRALPDHWGEQVFLWVHVPLFWAIFAGSDSAALRLGLSAFPIAHAGLHWLYRRHLAYEFNTPSSWGLIVLAGALGAAHLVLTL